MPLNPTVTPAVARRIADNGITFAYEVSNTHLVWGTSNPVLDIEQGTVKILPLVDIDARFYGSAAALATALVSRIVTLKQAYDSNYPSATFRFGIRISALPGLYEYQTGPGILPRLYGHPDDIPSGALAGDRYNPGQTFTIASSAGSTSCVLNASGRSIADLFVAGWYAGQTLTVATGTRAGETTTISGYNSTTGTMTYPALSGALSAGDTVTVSRTMETGGGIIGYYFFKHGITETAAYMTTLVTAIDEELTANGLPDPEAWVFTVEDWRTPTAFYDDDGSGVSVYERHLNDAKASDATYPVATIDGTDYTLAQFDAAFRSGWTPTWTTYNRFSPQSGPAREYCLWLNVLSMSRAFKLGAYDPINTVWPSCNCSLYQLGTDVGTARYPCYYQPGHAPSIGDNGGTVYGTMLGTIYFAVLVTPSPLSFVSRQSAEFETGIVQAGSTAGSIIIGGNTDITSQANAYWRHKEFWVTSGSAAYELGKIDTWDTATDTAGLYRPLSTAPSAGDTFNLNTGVATFVGGEYLNSGIGWEVWPAWRDFYRVTSTPEGYTEACDRFVEANAQAIADAFPDNATGFYIAPGYYGEGYGLIPPEYTHPDPAIELPDGYITPTHWGQELLIRMMRSGSNFFVVFNPDKNSMDSHATMISAFRDRLRDHYWRDILLQAGYDPNTAFDSTPTGAYTYAGSKPRGTGRRGVTLD